MKRDEPTLSPVDMLDKMTPDQLAACERRLVRRIDARMAVLLVVML